MFLLEKERDPLVTAEFDHRLRDVRNATHFKICKFNIDQYDFLKQQIFSFVFNKVQASLVTNHAENLVGK